VSGVGLPVHVLVDGGFVEVVEPVPRSLLETPDSSRETVVDTNVLADVVVASDGLVGMLDDMSMLVDLMVVESNMLVDMLMLVDMSVGMLMVVDDMLMLVDLLVDMSMGVSVVVVIHCWFLGWYTSSCRLFQLQSWSRMKLESFFCRLVLQCPSVVVALNCRTLPSHHSQGSGTHL